VRVNNHQIGFISTHRKIGHSPLYHCASRSTILCRRSPLSRSNWNLLARGMSFSCCT
jgi:hypothetical protein